MQLFLDTANLDEIKKYATLGLVDGVTTNPSLIAKEGVSLEKRIKEIAEVVDGPINTEVIATEARGMITEAHHYIKWHRNVYVKLPMTEEGLKALKVLSAEGVRTNITLVFSTAQVLLAAKAGATLISPFIGRLDDVAEPGMQLIEESMIIKHNYGFKSQILVASIRHPRHVIEAARLGADISTMPAEVMGKLLKHPLTDKGLKAFLDDWEKVKGKQ